MEQPSAYIPMDRRQALALANTLPDRTTGAALFADISGFTPLTEALARELGPQRGAEELTLYLNQVYDALISELHDFGGSVISFAGDAITCWLDGDDGRQAVACALAMQERMAAFVSVRIPSGSSISLSVKTAVAVGPVRRFVVGDPDIQLIDVLAGETLVQLALAANLADKGELLLTPESAAHLSAILNVCEWRRAESDQKRYAVVNGLQADVARSPWSEQASELTVQQAQRWLLPTVYDQLASGQGEFLAELRPAVALFMQFTGLDYDLDEQSGQKLNRFIEQVQRIINRYDGALLQVAIGDKGNYLYAAFGAPIAHEDDAARAVATAWELQNLALTSDDIDIAKIGIASGRMRTGAYGSNSRRTYGVLGDSVNLSARLMETAVPNQILTTQEIQQHGGDAFHWELLLDIQVKGKQGDIAIATVKGPRQRSMLRLLEPSYSLPMVGRDEELALISQKIELALAGQGQIIGLTAEAGMGKSRLVAEIIRLTNRKNMVGFAGECQSYGEKSSYHVWYTIWRAFFNVSGDLTQAEYVAQLEDELKGIDPYLLPRLPLLAAVLNLPIPDNDLTGSFDAKLRKSSLESLLVTCLRARAQDQPHLFIIEDSHWLDPLSHDLLEIIGRAVVDLPVFIILAYRSVDLSGDLPPRVQSLPYFTEITLSEFTTHQAEHLIRLKLFQLFDSDTAVSNEFIRKITERAEGNPFYIEELLNYFQDRQIDPKHLAAFETLDLPDSLHSLILSRIDRLTEAQKSTIKIASVIGRLFRATMLWGAYPELGEAPQVEADLAALSRLELTIPDTSEPELAYIFKHVVTQEATYESLPYSTRARLHTQIGEYIELTYADALDSYIPILAHHFEHGLDETKKRKYLILAAEDAHKKYAHQAAIAYYERVLPLLAEPEKVRIMIRLGETTQTVGQWPEAEALFRQALSLARELNDVHGRASCQTALADLMRMQGHYDDATERLSHARLNFEELGDEAGVGKTLHLAGTLAAQQGDYQKAEALWEESLTIRRQLGDLPGIASLLSNLGIIARYQGDFATAQKLYEESLAIRQEAGDKWAIYVSLTNLGLLALTQDDLEKAHLYLAEANQLARQVGDRWALANSLNNLANVTREQADFESAQLLYRESLQINRDLGDKRAVAFLFEDIGCLAALEQKAEAALLLVMLAANIRQEIGAPLAPNEQEKLDDRLTPARSGISAETQSRLQQESKAMNLDEAIVFATQL